MRAKVEQYGLWLTTSVLALLCVAPSGCKKAGSSEAPQMDVYAGDEAEREADDPLAELATLEDRMRAMGLPTASTPKSATTDTASSEAGGAVEHESTDAAMDEAPAPAEAEPPPSGSARQPPGQDACADVCSLSESICTLEVRICSLSESHGDDPVYTDACERAIEDCDVAGDACDGCRG